MRHNLNCLSEICALTLTAYDSMVYTPGSDIISLGCVDAKKSLIMSEIQVGLRPVVSHIAFPMLIRVERTGIDVDVRVEFLDSHTQPPCLEKFGQRGRNDSFSQ